MTRALFWKEWRAQRSLVLASRAGAGTHNNRRVAGFRQAREKAK